MSRRLEGQVAVVVGGAGGIGSEIARHLAREGAAVVVADLRAGAAEQVARGIVEHGGAASARALDITDWADVCVGVDSVVAAHGRLDILVNAAGHTPLEKTGWFAELAPEHVEWSLRVFLLGPLWCIRAAAPAMIRQRYGRIINISSVVGIGGRAGAVPYAAAKGGLIAATRGLAIELGRHNITVNCVSPGKVLADPSRRDLAESLLPYGFLPHVCGPSDVAAMVSYLAGPEASCITGQNFVVDCGRTLGLHGD